MVIQQGASVKQLSAQSTIGAIVCQEFTIWFHNQNKTGASSSVLYLLRLAQNDSES
jgi:hypothetical protein